MKMIDYAGGDNVDDDVEEVTMMNKDSMMFLLNNNINEKEIIN